MAPPGAIPRGVTGGPQTETTPADEDDDYAGRGVLYEDILLEGRVVLEMGPLGGVGELHQVEHALDGLVEVHSVRVRGFEGGRAALELVLADSTRLVATLRGVLPTSFDVLDADPGRLSIVLAGPGHGHA